MVLREPYASMAERIILGFVQRRLQVWSEAEQNRQGLRRSDAQINAGLEVTMNLLNEFGDHPLEIIQSDEVLTRVALENTIENSPNPDFRHYAYLNFGEYRGYIQGVVAALKEVQLES